LTDIPAWIGAIGTVGTLSTGLILFAGSMSDRRQEYARSVAVWTDFHASEFEITDEGLRSLSQEVVVEGAVIKNNIVTNDPNLGNPFEFALHLKNKGLQPIYSCTLWARLDHARLPSWGTYLNSFERLNLDFRIIAPEFEESRSLIKGYLPANMPAPANTDMPEILAKALTFRLRFTDAAGRSWIRNETGRLRRLHRWQRPPDPSYIVEPQPPRSSSPHPGASSQ
jgi:hypothetical protein